MACERHFKASRRQVDAWLRQIGKANLIEARSGGVASQRESGAWVTRQTCMVATRKRKFRGFLTIDDKRQVPLHVLTAAVRFLQIVRNGGWIVTRSQLGDWRVGTRVMSSYQLVEMAISKGFDVKEVRE